MKEIFFVRHAKSSWDDPNKSDFDRPLNERGLKDAPKMAKLMSEKSIIPHKLVSSSANRALTTCQYFAQAFHIPTSDILQTKQLYAADAQAVLNVIHNFEDTWSVVFLFSHNPVLTFLANLFSESWIDNIPTAGIFHIKADIEHWKDFSAKTVKLEHLYFPKEI